jgi:hypothetical protein
MRTYRTFAGVASLGLLFTGCRAIGPGAEGWPAVRAARLADRDAVARCLPPPIRLDTPLTPAGTHVPWEHTVEAALAKVGARVGPDGKLYSAAGKEIYFDYRPSGGPPPLPMSEEQREDADRAHRDLVARYTVITVVYLHC